MIIYFLRLQESPKGNMMIYKGHSEPGLKINYRTEEFRGVRGRTHPYSEES